MPEGARPRLILPDAAPVPAARLLARAGWETVRTPRAGDLPCVWAAAPGPGEVGLEPLALGDPDRLAGLRLHPGAGVRDIPSLARLLAEDPLDDTALLDRARDAMARMRHWGLATAPLPLAPPAGAPPPGHVLVLDEAPGASPRADLLEALFLARTEHPAARLLVLSPPGGGQIRDADLGPAARVADTPPLHDLLEGAVAVYTVAARAGFDAILAGHRPVVLGRPFWAGLGLTDDRGPGTARGRALTRAQLFAAAMILAPIWHDPHRDAAAPIEDAISAAAALARAAREDRSGYVAAGLGRWKRRHMRAFLGGDVRFARRPEAGAALARRLGRPLVLWGSAAAPGDTAVLRAEDGFLRSAGLGARLVPPLSLALDPDGIYYDPARASRLEHLIAAAAALPPAEIRRAEALVARIRATGVTKYNISGGGADLPEGAILVPGQVEDDASVLTGAGAVRTNLELLRAVRDARPGAAVFYKPHPDVEAGLRPGRVPEAQVRDLADGIVTGDPARLLRPGVAVWTITSLLGFEALLRGLTVTTLGTPFYAGWGLTRDLGEVPGRRRARPGLAGLAHAALIGYPRYRDPRTGLPCPPEIAVERLAAGEGWPTHPLLARLQGLRARLRPR